MNKYLEVFRRSFKMQLTWRFDVAMTVVTTVFKIVAARILWGVVFNGTELVGGFTFQSMLSYYIVSTFISSLDKSPHISEEVSELIRAGRFSGHMVVPMNPFGYFSAFTAGESVFHVGYSLIAATLCAVFFRVHITLTADIRLIMAAVVMMLLGLLFMSSFHFFLGILTFKFQNITGLRYIAGHLTLFATGVLVPLSLLPDALVRLMHVLPFYYVTYLPSMLLSGRLSGEALTGIIVLFSWSLGLLLLNKVFFTRLRIRYDGVGI